MRTTDNVGLKLYEGTDLFNPLVVENPNCETLDEVIKAISDQAVGSATELVTGTVHALTRGLDDGDRDVFIFTATSNFTAGDTFTLDGVQMSALTVAGTQLSSNCYIIGSSVLVHKRDTLLTFYVSETTAKDAEKLGGELPSYYATKTGLDAVVADISALATKIGTAVLTTQAPDLSGAVNELNTHLKWVDITNDCTWNSGLTYVRKAVYKRGGEVMVDVSISPSGFISGANIVTFPSGVKFLLPYAHTGLCEDGLGVAQSESFAMRNGDSNLNSLVVVKSTNNYYIASTVTIPIEN